MPKTKRKQPPRHLDARTPEGAAYRARLGQKRFDAARAAYRDNGTVPPAPKGFNRPAAPPMMALAPRGQLRAIGALNNAITALRTGDKIAAVKFLSLGLARIAGDLDPEGHTRESVKREILAHALANVRGN